MTELNRIVLIEPVGGHGGMDHYDYGLALGLTMHNCQVDFFTCNNTTPIAHPWIQQHNSFGSVWQTAFKPIKLLRFFYGYWKAFRFAKKHKALAIHLHFFDLGRLNQWVLFMGSLFSSQIFVTLHDISSLSGRSFQHFTKQLEKKTKGIIVHNNYSFQNLLAISPKLRHKTRILHHGSYVQFIRAAAPLEPLTFSEQEPLKILFFGQIKPTKGLPVLLRAMQLLDAEKVPVHLTIAGKPWQMDPKTMAELESQCNEITAVSYQFTYIPNEEVRTYFERTHMVVLPYEQIYQSGVLLLAMSYGRTVLCSDLPAFKEIIRDQENGLLFEGGNPRSLADKIKKIVEQPALLNQLETKANETVRIDFSWEIIAGKTLNFYSDSE